MLITPEYEINFHGSLSKKKTLQESSTIVTVTTIQSNLREVN